MSHTLDLSQCLPIAMISDRLWSICPPHLANMREGEKETEVLRDDRCNHVPASGTHNDIEGMVL